MGLKGLAEGIILQSIEDLWSENQRAECIAFFTGKEFGICAEIAGMNLADQLKVLNMVKSVIANSTKSKSAEKDNFCQRGKRPARTAKRACRIMQAVT